MMPLRTTSRKSLAIAVEERLEAGDDGKTDAESAYLTILLWRSSFSKPDSAVCSSCAHRAEVEPDACFAATTRTCWLVHGTTRHGFT